MSKLETKYKQYQEGNSPFAIPEGLSYDDWKTELAKIVENKPSKYFAKYLPVEGGKPSQIPAGKNVPVMRDGKITFFQLETSEKMGKFMALEGYKKGSYLPAKLFLCSRDIQVGDKVYACNGGIFKNYKIEEFIIIEKPIEYKGEWIGEFVNPEDEITLKGKAKLGWSSIYLPYKVIGEMSPDATWVKEGDEFDEDELMWTSIDVNGYDSQSFVAWNDKDSYGYEYVGVKGPCGHFH